MPLNKVTRWLAMGYATFIKRTNPAIRAMIVSLTFVGVFVGVGIYNDRSNDHALERVPSSEHLKRALVACGADSKNCLDPADAYRELWAIPKSAKEFNVASALLLSIQQQQISNQPAASKLPASEQPYNQMQRNVRGLAHDAFTCANSTENTPIMSFDSGGSWWKDDGRCAEQLQKAKDSEAQIHSYWSTTLRVDTDMDSFWLPDEERTCQSYPDDKGKVSVVACNPTGSHRDHNIPVKFWGGVERNTVSDWKCRREGDAFVCRATD